jgi:hypothetical protein
VPTSGSILVSRTERRPDLRAAELRLRETLAQTDATRLSFYPNLSLTGSVGTASTGLSEIVSNPLGSLAATLSAPFIQVNQAHFATAVARAQYDKAVVSFRKTLLKALIDVDNALSARIQLAEEGANLEHSFIRWSPRRRPNGSTKFVIAPAPCPYASGSMPKSRAANPNSPSPATASHPPELRYPLPNPRRRRRPTVMNRKRKKSTNSAPTRAAAAPNS